MNKLFNNNNIDLPVLYYKTFLLLIMSGQGYMLFLMVGDIITMFFNIMIITYAIFRYYMLIRVKRKADALSLTITAYLKLNREVMENSIHKN